MNVKLFIFNHYNTVMSINGRLSVLFKRHCQLDPNLVASFTEVHVGKFEELNRNYLIPAFPLTTATGNTLE